MLEPPPANSTASASGKGLSTWKLGLGGDYQDSGGDEWLFILHFDTLAHGCCGNSFIRIAFSDIHVNLHCRGPIPTVGSLLCERETVSEKESFAIAGRTGCAFLVDSESTADTPFTHSS